MVVIEPTEDGRLRISNARQSAIVVDEAEARARLYSWGHTDISINRALAEMRERTTGIRTPDAGWRVARAAGPPMPGPSDPGTPHAEPARDMAATPRKRRGRAAAEAAPEASPEEVPPVEEVRPKRARRRSRAEAVPAVAGDAADAPAKPAGKGRRRTAAGAAEPAPAPEPVPDAPDRPRRGRRARTQEAAAGESTAAPPAPTREPAPPETAAPAPAVPAEAAPEPPATPASRPRRARRSRAAEATIAAAPGQPAAARAEDLPEPTDPIAAARYWFERGTSVLRDIEKETLVFARAPWTELRERAQTIVDALRNEEPSA